MRPSRCNWGPLELEIAEWAIFCTRKKGGAIRKRKGGYHGVQGHQVFCGHGHRTARRRSLELRVGSRCTIERCGPHARYLAGTPTRSRTQPDSERGSARTRSHSGFASVLEGTVRSQLNGGDVIEYSAGQSGVESSGTVHTRTEHPSQTMPARHLAVFIAPTGAQLTTVDKERCQELDPIHC